LVVGGGYLRQRPPPDHLTQFSHPDAGSNLDEQPQKSNFMPQQPKRKVLWELPTPKHRPAFTKSKTAPESYWTTKGQIYDTTQITLLPVVRDEEDQDGELMEEARKWSTPVPVVKIGTENLLDEGKFELDKGVVDMYTHVVPKFGFGGLGEIVYRRTYSRIKSDGQNEKWFESVARVVNGTYSMQKRWILERKLAWDEKKAQKSAAKMFDKIFNFKFLPPGRGLWAMGSPLTEERGLFAALNNCAFVSTADMWNKVGGSKPSKPFAFLFDMSMLGVGVGFDTKGACLMEETEETWSSVVSMPNTSLPVTHYEISDDREGWTMATSLIIDSFLANQAHVVLNYDKIRPEGRPIRGFGGVASGPGPLKHLHSEIARILTSNVGKTLSITAIVDMMNLIGKCVVSGNVRRTAEIAFGEMTSPEYVNLKNYELNPHRAEYGWTSNNSVFCKVGDDYTPVIDAVSANGEPGFFWLDNAQRFGRMADAPNNRDYRAMGGNPCLEQTLESFELCCLVETFPYNHDTWESFQETLKYAYIYAKTVTLGSTHCAETNRVMLRNRRIGASMSGIAQFISKFGLDNLRRWCDDGYQYIQKCDEYLSDWLVIPRSIKTTSIKPSGTVSLLAGATPGMHYPESRFCIRRIRISRLSDLVEPLRKAGYKVEPAVGNEEASCVVDFPIDFGEGLRSLDEISMWEQLSLAALLQRHWSDNQVSCTITFDPEREGPSLIHALQYFQYQLKGISFLPRISYGAYPQMPYEAIDKETYLSMKKRVDPTFLTTQLSGITLEHPVAPAFCDTEVCEMPRSKSVTPIPENN
jgi:ribonucleoside-triphosphate reductase